MRWVVKKAARKGLATTTWLTGALRASTSAPRVHVLTYHRFGQAVRDPFTVSAAAFEAQVAWLARNALAVSLDQIADYLAGRVTLRDGSVLVTVDDGYRCMHRVALPILQAHGVPAVAFVPVAEVGNEERLSWDDLRELQQSGITIGSHAWSHRSMARLSRAEARGEAQKSRIALEEQLARPVTAFAYPYGTLADFDAATGEMLRESGYQLGFTSQHGPLVAGEDPFALPRVKVEGGEGLWTYRLLARGGLDGWRWVDRSLWWLQASGR